MTSRRQSPGTPWAAKPAKPAKPARLAAVAVASAVVLLGAPAAASSSPAVVVPAASPTVVPSSNAPTSAIGGARLAEAGVVVALGVSAPPVNEAASYVIADVDTGEVLAAKAAHQPELPASTLKILTALTLLPELDPAEIVVGSAEAAAVDGSKAGIYPGLNYSIDLVFKAMLLQSGNDAAVTLSLAAGGVQRTVDTMNDVASDLYALDTVAANPSGLDAPGQVTSAYDLALITRAALARDDFRAYITTQTADMPDVAGATYQIQNENRFLASYAGAIGVKNGYTTLARHTFVGAAERNGRTLVVTVMKTEGRPEPIAAALMDWGFANAEVAPVGLLVLPTDPLPAQPADDAAPATAAVVDGRIAPPGQSANMQPDAVSSTALVAGDSGEGWGRTLVAVGLCLVASVVLLRARVLWRLRRRL